MKVKEQSVWLSVLAFIHLVVMASTGAVINEFLKIEKNIFLILLSLLIGAAATGLWR